MIEQARQIKLVLARPEGDVLVDAKLDPPSGAVDLEDFIYGVYVANFAGYELTIYVSNTGSDLGLPVAGGTALLEHPRYGDLADEFSEMSPIERVLSVVKGSGPMEISVLGWWEPSDAGRVAVIPLDKYGSPNCRLLIREIYFTSEAYR